MDKRTWSYEEITAEAEARIKCLMEMAAKAPTSGFEDYAWGVYCLWNSLTGLVQAPGDAERLEAMTEVHCG